MSLPLVKLAGTAYEQGVEHGRQLRQRIGHNLDVYFDRFRRDSLLSREEVLRRASLYLPAIASHNRDYRDGMAGIAEGSGYTLEEIAALNVRYEIIYYQRMSQAVAAARDGCTSFALARHRSKNGHLIIGQNWDWIPHVLGAVLHTIYPDGFQTLAFSEAGIFGGKIGLNSAGLGVCVNGISSTADDWTSLQKPFHLRCYEILRSRQFAEAVRVVTDTARSCSANFLIGQSPDEVIDIEAAPESVNLIGLEGGSVVHTNHFVAPQEMGIAEPPSERRHLSCRRLDRMVVQQPGFRRHVDASPDEIVELMPPFNNGEPFLVPHRQHVEDDYADCVDCHMHYSRQSANEGDIRSHTLLPNEVGLGGFALPHYSETCGQCHSEAPTCVWCHGEFGGKRFERLLGDAPADGSRRKRSGRRILVRD